ncbi:acyltransferase [uncultured Alistipes sp.]|jgi:peptidoglycan/LPS O-acetylase OafA/YrhL|uniref:acyltransferase n=1 Tax=uncultured Alistipes sp. TaxID=538949 RepID=UPI003431C6C5
MRTSKNLYIQELRCICIIAVIGIHAFTLQPESANSLYWGVTFRQFINFPVAFFFFLAGYFAKPAKLHVRIKRILIPYFIWTSIYWIKPLIFHSGAISWGGVLLSYINGTGPGFHLYFLVVLFQLVLLTPLCYRMLNSHKSIFKWILFSVTPIFLILIYWLKINHIDILYQIFFPTWIFFFALGIYLKNYKKIQLTGLTISILCFLALLASIAEAYQILDIDNISWAISQIKYSSFIYTFCLILLAIKIQVNTQNNIWVTVGNYSYGIYLLHILVLSIIIKLVSTTGINMLLPHFILFLLYVTLTLLSCVLIISICHKTLPNKLLEIIGFR